MSISFQIKPGDTFDQTINCLKLLNRELDLRDFYKLITDIEQLNRSKLTQWKNDFTTKFLKKVREFAKSFKKNPKTKTFYLQLVSVTNFSAFVQFYDYCRSVAPVSLNSEVEIFLSSFFEFVSDVKFQIVCPEEELKEEFEKTASEKWWSVKLDFARSALELIRTGVRLGDMVSWIEHSFSIDPNAAIRQSTAIQSPKLVAASKKVDPRESERRAMAWESIVKDAQDSGDKNHAALEALRNLVLHDDHVVLEPLSPEELENIYSM